jgi:amidophosphoribosyltransferase
MSDQIKHECGLAFVRLLKPLSYYQEKYGTSLYGLNKLQLLMQKQRNRGQDGAGIATIKLDMQPGSRYISRRRSNNPQYLKHLFEGVMGHFDDCTPEQLSDPDWLKHNKPYTGEVMIGHLRYGTHGANTIETVHPFLRQSNYINRNLVTAGNFNLTNVDELFAELIDFGQYPKEKSDSVTVLEKIGHFLDSEVQRLFNWFKPEGYSNQEINSLIAEHLDLQRILSRACRKFDGGYVMAGMIGHGDAFILRDPAGIRPAYYYQDDEIVVAASERPAIQTAIDAHYDEVKEIERGHALLVKKNGEVSVQSCKEQLPRTACSFERIYFSRGTDRDIYLERKELGKLVVPKIMEVIKDDLKHTIFSFIPNTAEVAFYGMVEELRAVANRQKAEKIAALGKDISAEQVADIMLSHSPRIEKLAVKDAKLRTFIADDIARGEMVGHVYDVTYGIVKNNVDTVALIDDSIVRGTTLRDSVISILSRLKPKKIIIISSAPQIRYPDCYGIDMSKMWEFVAFKALISLIKKDKKEALLKEAYERCMAEEDKPLDEMVNQVQPLYALYKYDEITAEIAKIITPSHIDIEVELIYQTVEDLKKACPDNTGDWYFSGNYPTLGGVRVVNRSFINYYEGKNERAY